MSEIVQRVGDWVRYPKKIFALLNVLMVIIGVNWLRFAVAEFQLPSQVVKQLPYASRAFYIMTIINGVLLAGLLAGSLYLWSLRPLGTKICSVVFFAEIVYWSIKKPVLFLLLAANSDALLSVRAAISGTSALGNAGLAFQKHILYPIWGLLVLFAVSRARLHP